MQVIMLLVSFELFIIYSFSRFLSLVLMKRVNSLNLFINIYVFLLINIRLRIVIYYFFLVFSYNLMLFSLTIFIDLFMLYLPVAHAEILEETIIIVNKDSLKHTGLVGLKKEGGLKSLLDGPGARYMEGKHQSNGVLFSRKDIIRGYYFMYNPEYFKYFLPSSALKASDNVVREICLSESVLEKSVNSKLAFINNELDQKLEQSFPARSLDSNSKNKLEDIFDLQLYITKAEALEKIISEGAFLMDKKKFNAVLESFQEDLGSPDLKPKLRTACASIKD